MVNTNAIVYALILNYKNFNDTIECIENLLKSKYENLKIIVVDNNSLNNSIQQIEQWLNNTAFNESNAYSYYFEHDDNIKFDNKITFVEAESNNGFAYGNNIILKKLYNKDCYVFMINPDIIAEPKCIAELVCFTLNTPSDTITGCKILYYKTGHLKYYGGVKFNHLTGTVSLVTKNQNKHNDYICGGAIFFHASALNKIGLLPEDYFLYWEDAEWGYMAKKAGYKLITCADAIVYDKGSTSIGRGYLAEYYYTRNALIFHKKIGKQVLTIITSNLFFRLPKRILLGQLNRAKAVITGTIDYINKSYRNAPKKEITIN